MKKIKKFIFIIIVSTLFISCRPSTYITVNDISRNIAYLDVTIRQVISNKEALAYTPNGEVIKLITDKEVYYVGKRIEGKCILVGTETLTLEQTHVGINAKIGYTESEMTIPVFRKEIELIEAAKYLNPYYG